jgi:hypothetical protein
LGVLTIVWILAFSEDSKEFLKELIHLESKFTLLQSNFFSRQIFLLYFGNGNFGGKKFYFTKE